MYDISLISFRSKKSTVNMIFVSVECFSPFHVLVTIEFSVAIDTSIKAPPPKRFNYCKEFIYSRAI